MCCTSIMCVSNRVLYILLKINTVDADSNVIRTCIDSFSVYRSYSKSLLYEYILYFTNTIHCIITIETKRRRIYVPWSILRSASKWISRTDYTQSYSVSVINCNSLLPSEIVKIECVARAALPGNSVGRSFAATSHRT